MKLIKHINVTCLLLLCYQLSCSVNAINVPTIKLSSNQQIPVIGLGTYKTHYNHEVLVDAIKTAVEFGYRHFDLALCYENEDVIGRALKEIFSDGKYKREDFFIVDKLWNTYHSKEEVPKCIDLQLNSLGLDYFDLYLMHWPMGFKEKTGSIYPTDENGKDLYSDVHYLETYKAMEELVEQGKVKSIGLSNFNITQIEDLLKNCKFKPVVNQVEVHPYYQNNELIDYCQKNDIIVTAYAPLGARDRAWLQASDPVLLDEPVLQRISQKYKKTPAQICLKWLLQRNLITVPKSVTPARLRENINVFDFVLNDEDMYELSRLDKGFQYYGWPEANDHPFYPFK